MIDTGASCSVFDLNFVENNHIPWRKREKPVRIVSASRTPIPYAGKALTNDCSVLFRDGGQDRVIPITTEIFHLEKGIDLILGMDWLRANTKGLRWDVSDRIVFHRDVSLPRANTEKLVAQDGANVKRQVTDEEKLGVKVDFQVVSSLIEWDDVVANGFAAGCIWSTG